MNRTTLDPNEARVLVLAPLGRDARLLCHTITQVGIACQSCSAEELQAELALGVGVLLLTEEALTAETIATVKQVVESQPDWSDLPLVLLVSAARKGLEAFDVANSTTVLERPTRMPTLVTVVRSALTARRRQYQLRELLTRQSDLNAQLELRVSARTKQVQNLAAQLTLTEAKERARLAQVLHDELQQQLYAVQFSLQGLRVHLGDNATAVTQLEDTKHVVDGAIAICRSTTANLSPPVLRHEGLVEALTWLGSDMAARYQLVVTVEASASFTVPDEEVRVLLFNLVRELLFNVVKHAEVGDALVTLHQSADQLELTVSDLGKGFDSAKLAASPTGLGLAGVRQRLELFGGQLDLVSIPHKGTRVTILLPAESFTLS